MRTLFSRIRGDEPSGAVGPDGFTVNDETPFRDEQLLLSRLLGELFMQETHIDADDKARELVVQLLKRDERELIELAKALAVRLAFTIAGEARFSSRQDALANLRAIWAITNFARLALSRLLQRKLPYSEEDFLLILGAFGNLGRGGYWKIPSGLLVARLEGFIEANGMSIDMQRALRSFRRGMVGDYARVRKLRQRVDVLLGDVVDELVEPGEPWTDALLADLNAMQPKERQAWEDFLLHASQLNRPAPSKRWRAAAHEKLEAVGADELARRFFGWFEYLAVPAQAAMPANASNVLRGMVWFVADLPGPEASRALGELALRCYRKIRGIGARSRKVGNACLQALAARADLESVSELARIRQKVRYVEVQRLAGAAMLQAAEHAGLTVEDLEELAIPTFELNAEGHRSEAFDELTAEIAISSGGRARLSWRNARGKALKSVPTIIRRDHKDDLKRLRKSTKEINSAISVQRKRLERLMVQERTWPFEVWRERYIEHPLVASLARDLIWRFRRGQNEYLGIWYEGTLRGRDGQPVSELSRDAEVSLWHPLGCAVDEIMAWRLWLEGHQVTQAFKQAHREVYILTDAERATGTYSNRFAAHILRQHQFAALCQERGWRYQLQGAWDSHNTPSVDFPHWNLRAEFWVDAIRDDGRYSEAFIDLYVATDQVRFYNLEGELLDLSEVPPLPFSEILRDVDLFVVVCSVGNDPAWEDRGADGNLGRYWQSYSFGDLSATAQTRKEVLERLLPRLKIADQCSVDGKFLVVRGELNTYRIHLGSGNVLMEPGGQYLCIVQGRRARSGTGHVDLFLPFEGDRLLSVILSKAILLASDHKISDPTILSQIRRS